MIRPTEASATDGLQYALAPGTPITMSPAGATATLCLAEVLAWSVSPSGLVVTARAVTDPATADQLDNRTVFVSGRTPDDALVVLEAVARHSEAGSGVLELVSVAGLAREHRRAAVRAAVAVPVLLNEVGSPAAPELAAPQQAGIPAITIDLSADGCRLRLSAALPLAVGSDVITVLDLGGPDPIEVTGVVVRSAPQQSEIIVSFDPMRLEDAAAIDATVYEALRR